MDCHDGAEQYAEFAVCRCHAGVFHSSVLFYVPAPRRAAFVEVVRALPGHGIANEGPATLDWTRPQGQAVTWFSADVVP